MALPASANLSIPDDPLTTAARIAPNILFILDDSGSMAFDYMPDSIPSTTSPNVARYAYTRNTLSYNPATTYRPWMLADGSRMTGGTSFNAVYGSFNLAGGNTIDLANSNSCRRYNNNNNATTDEFSSGATQVCGGVQTFYVPKDTSRTDGAYLGAGASYYRYQVTSDDVIRSEYGAVTSASDEAPGYPQSGISASRRNWARYTVIVPAGTTGFTVSTSGGSGDPDLYVRAGSAPETNRSDCSSTRSGTGETCTINNPVAGSTYHIGIYAYSDFSNVRLSVTLASNNRCAAGSGANDWVNCQSVTPTGRSISDEQRNYATWFSYYRTRMKSAKAGASEAFAPLDGTVRVGFRTIWDRSGSRFDIPVGDGNDGRFVDSTDSVRTTSRSTWYARLQGVIGYNGTPLHSALDNAGKYFSSSEATGPYGPQSGASQYSCRQNFAILTTDGYWNNRDIDVGNQDNQRGQPITGVNNQSYTYEPSAPFKDDHGNTLADVAMKYWKTDLRTDMANNVPVTTANPAFWQHMVTFGISIGLRGNKPWSSVAEVPHNATWENPNDAEDADRIDDLLHAAVNSRGAFVSASNPSEFTEGLGAALAAIAERTSSYSNVATNSVSLDAGSQVFSASYVSGVWTGTVTARAVSRAGVASTATWSATTPAWGSRKIYTSTGSRVGAPGASGANFPTSIQETALTRGGGTANFEISGAENANYLKGRPNLEVRNGGTLRNRTSIIGDIVGSSPAYVPDTKTLYVGANDGMLHAFDAQTGLELFAYVPNIINFGALSTLSRGDYAHRFFVDGPVVVSDRRVTDDKNILVGTLGRGGKGLYALDVTTPTSTSGASVFKWERNALSGGEQDHMGLVLGKPFFARAASGTSTVVFGNGINSRSQRAVLVVLDAGTGAVIRQIDTGDGSATAPNGLSTATGVFGADGRTLAYVYAGDMRGNVWKFDLRSSTPADWKASKLFTAGNGTDIQPITAAVTVATHPRTRKTWVFFGTGRYLVAEDADADSAASAVVQGMYGFMENEDGTTVLRSELTQRNLRSSSETMDGYAVRSFDAKAVLPDGSKGWYINLPEQGERIVQDAQVVSTFLVTASMVPKGSACEADGSGYINALDAFTGTSAGGSYFDLDGDGSTDDSVVDGRPVGSINPGVGMPTLPNLLRGRVIVGGTSGDVGGAASLVPRWDRVSWREVRRD